MNKILLSILFFVYGCSVNANEYNKDNPIIKKEVLTVPGKIDICNMALNSVGEAAISTLDETKANKDSRKAIRLCNRYFDQVLEKTLVRYQWKCAIKRQLLVKDDTAPLLDDYDNQFHLPPDWLRVLQANHKDTQFNVEGDFLLCNESSATIRYIRRMSDLGNLHPFAVDAIAQELGSKLALPLQGVSKGLDVKNNLLAELKITIKEAKVLNAIESNEPSFATHVNPSSWNRRHAGKHPFGNLRLTAPS